LDEPTAGLDPQGRKEMMEMFWRLHKEQQITIVLVTHLMDDVANFADYVYVLEKGRIVNSGEPQEVFQNIEWLKEKQLGVPTATEFAEELMAKGMNFATLPLTAEELADAIVHYAGGNAHDE
ncbi:TPA: energy-coupling factor ABC transporter ATP-binding protein, partial [Enterococcus faecium]|nr:energy-coupling factor ABC transporter ATP-binding protein [Enterococcus faecium]